MTVALLFARTLDLADHDAVHNWHWQRTDELRSEYRRPDSGERVRYVPDIPGTLSGHGWGTTAYLGSDWAKRRDAAQIKQALDCGLFITGDPELPPPRPRTRREDALNDIRRTLSRLERNT